MADMIAVIPSRGRPENIARQLKAFEQTCQADTRIAYGFDSDDRRLGVNIDAIRAKIGGTPRVMWSIQSRRGLAQWTNDLAMSYAADTPVLCSLGDDHVPVTEGWDVALIEAIGHIDGGWAYPDDSRREDIAEAVAVSSSIVQGLGAFIPVGKDGKPIVHHWCCDNAWTALARAVGRLEFLRHVKVPHYHPHSPDPALQVPADPTYEEARWSYDLDKRRYLKWRDQGGLKADAAKVCEILGIEVPQDV